MFLIYIVTSGHNGTLYIGHTDDLGRRISEHKNKTLKGFSSRYSIDKLVWFEEFETREEAFKRERQIKKWNRAWKIRLIETHNPDWVDIMALSVWPTNQDWSRTDII